MTLLSTPRPTTTPTQRERIDRLNCTAGLSFITYGKRVGLRVNAAESLVERLYSLQVAADQANSKTRRLHLLQRDAGNPAHGNDLDQIFEALESDLQSTTLFPKRPAAIRLFVAQSGNKRRT